MFAIDLYVNVYQIEKLQFFFINSYMKRFKFFYIKMSSNQNNKVSLAFLATLLFEEYVICQNRSRTTTN